MFWNFPFLHYVAEADSIAHTVYSPGSQAVKDVVEEFGSHILVEGTKDNGQEEIDRKKLGEVVFADPKAMSVSY